MHTPTQDLIEEHGGIMLMLEIMKRVAERLKKGEVVEESHLKKIGEFLREFADRCHHGKEEDILFPELVRAEVNRSLVTELVGEHKTGRDLIRGMGEAMGGYAPGNAEAVHLATNMEGYIRLLTEHIRKENEVLFPMVDGGLTEGIQETIKNRYDALEREVIGLGKHEEYHGWLDELRLAYLGQKRS